MGVVREVGDTALGRRLAIKVLAPDWIDSELALERFRREARIAASIDDPNCVFVYGAFEFDGSPAIAMELMSGGTLEEASRCSGGVAIRTAEYSRKRPICGWLGAEIRLRGSNGLHAHRIAPLNHGP